MNISTYEARIKALEDQLNPPGPSGGGDIESISISPDFGGVNAKLAAMMPLRWEDGEPIEGAPASVRRLEINIDSEEAPEQPEQVSITVTPSNGGYAYTVSQTDGQPAFGEKNEQVSATLTKPKNLERLYTTIGASDANSVEAASRVISVSFSINY